MSIVVVSVWKCIDTADIGDVVRTLLYVDNLLVL